MMNLVSKIGKPVCIVLYIVCAVLAFKKKFIPLISLFAMHLSEYFIICRKTAKEYGVGAGEGLAKCLAFGFTWWLPIRKADSGKDGK
jgi:hypothetical protein